MTGRDARFAWGLVWRSAALAGASALVAVLLWTTAPMAFGYRPNLVTSDSMSPLIRAGDVVLTRSVERADVRRGDVILVDDPGRDQPLLHRVSAIVDGRIVTKGDANPTPDRYSDEGFRVLGRGGLLVPRAGVGMLALRHGPGTALMAVGLAVIAWGMAVAARCTRS